ncbi:hypothetical protein [Sphingopyxis sp. H115]|uniref:hypothetical protein n=1 Tax=Sphingopyxis sp. H115 TaxID=1759073 RepID=UPI0007377F30|nr:hypothetical protein [Sphingopyxis sp. H115]KTE16992.1 hypothetical protein ATE71_03095 [Sphingopyxis sp. H115]
MIRSTALFDRLIAALCVALMIAYAAAVPAKAADQIQHSPAFMISHDHGDVGNFTLDAVHDSHDEHADHHDDAPADDEGTRADHLAGGHHHHGDTGPNLLVPNAAVAAAIAVSAALHGIGKDRQFAGLRPIGPERPPRLGSLTA